MIYANWEIAPEWANYFHQNVIGSHFWLEKHPDSISKGRREQIGREGFGMFKEIIEARP